MDDRVEVLGCGIDPVTTAAAVERVAGWIRRGESRRGIAVNAHKLALRRESAAVRIELCMADLVFADGVSIQLAAGARGHRLRRVPGVELAQALLDRADRDGWRVALLGARPEVIDRLARPGRWTHPGWFDDEDALAAQIRTFDPDLLLVGMGSPRQEAFLARQDGCGARFALGVGGSLDVLAGAASRAPAWARNSGLEGVWRIATEPRARWRRLGDALAMFPERK